MTVKVSNPHNQNLLLGIWKHFSTRRRIQLGLSFLLMLLSGVAELLSLGSVIPFLIVLTNPETLWGKPLVQQIIPILNISKPQQLIIPSLLVFILMALVSCVIRLTSMWSYGRLVAAVGTDLSCEAYRRSLYQPYQVHLERNTSQLIASMTSYISMTLVYINASLQIVSSSIVTIFLVSGLLVIDAQISVISFMIFIVGYSVIGSKTRSTIKTNGIRITEASNERIKAVQEGLGSIRDVLLSNNQEIFSSIYSNADRSHRKLEFQNTFLSIIPRYVLEALGMVVLALVGWLLVIQNGSSTTSVSLLGAIALGLQRLLPASQQIYSGLSALNSQAPGVQNILQLLNQPIPRINFDQKQFSLSRTINIQSVNFRYKPDSQEVLKNISLEINKGERIGLIGTTGSGKSTLVDIVMGLLPPSSGKIIIDGMDLHDKSHPGRLEAWRSSVSHVPQNIFLSDNSIAENIAFGVPKNLIDFDRIAYAAKLSKVSGFIESLPDGYLTNVGERGIRLSGGQRQRLGIARALYHDISIIILDEATSALDAKTEMEVMKSIEYLRSDLTIIMIAHRLTTVANCDRIIKLENGQIVSSGKPEILLKE